MRIILLSILLAASKMALACAPGTVAYYQFQSTGADACNTNNLIMSGTLSYTTGYCTTIGGPDNVGSFSSVNFFYAPVTLDVALSNLSAYTVEFYVDVTVTSRQATVWSAVDSYFNDYVAFDSSGNLYWSVRGQSPIVVPGFTAGTCWNVGLTFDGTNARVYRNNTLLSITIINFGTGSIATAYVGIMDGTSLPFVGWMTGLRFSNVVRTSFPTNDSGYPTPTNTPTVTLTATPAPVPTEGVFVSNLTPQFTQIPQATAQNTPTQVPTATPLGVLTVDCANCTPPPTQLPIPTQIPVSAWPTQVTWTAISNLTPQFTQLPYPTVVPYATVVPYPTVVPWFTALPTTTPGYQGVSIEAQTYATVVPYPTVVPWFTALPTATAIAFPTPYTQYTQIPIPTPYTQFTQLPYATVVPYPTVVPWFTALPTATAIAFPTPYTQYTQIPIPTPYNVIAVNGGTGAYQGVSIVSQTYPTPVTQYTQIPLATVLPTATPIAFPTPYTQYTQIPIPTVQAIAITTYTAPVPTPSTSTYTTNTAATNNAYQIKSSGGRLYSVSVANSASAAGCYVYFYNSTTQPTPGTSVVAIGPLGANAFTYTNNSGAQVYNWYPNGIAFGTGIWCTICGGTVANPSGVCTPTTNNQGNVSVSYQ